MNSRAKPCIIGSVASYDLALRLGAGVRFLRERRGLTQAELAYQANIKAQTLVKIEHGKGNPCMETIEGVCSALETDLPLLLAQPSRSSG